MRNLAYNNSGNKVKISKAFVPISTFQVLPRCTADRAHGINMYSKKSVPANVLQYRRSRRTTINNILANNMLLLANTERIFSLGSFYALFVCFIATQNLVWTNLIG